MIHANLNSLHVRYDTTLGLPGLRLENPIPKLVLDGEAYRIKFRLETLICLGQDASKAGLDPIEIGSLLVFYPNFACALLVFYLNFACAQGKSNRFRCVPKLKSI